MEVSSTRSDTCTRRGRTAGGQGRSWRTFIGGRGGDGGVTIGAPSEPVDCRNVLEAVAVPVPEAAAGVKRSAKEWETWMETCNLGDKGSGWCLESGPAERKEGDTCDRCWINLRSCA